MIVSFAVAMRAEDEVAFGAAPADRTSNCIVRGLISIQLTGTQSSSEPFRSRPPGIAETENRSSRNPPHASKASPAGNLSTKRRQPTTMSLSRFIFSVVDDDQCRRDQNEDSKPRDPADVQRH